MLRKILSSKNFLALILPLAICPVAYAGGQHCTKQGGQTAAHAGSAKGSHCHLAKNITKTATLTEDGAVVLIQGKTADAVEHIKTHLTTHEKGEDCKHCPMSMEGVTTQVKLTDKGGEVTLSGSSEETIKAVKEWASKPAGACCAEDKAST